MQGPILALSSDSLHLAICLLLPAYFDVLLQLPELHMH